MQKVFKKLSLVRETAGTPFRALLFIVLTIYASAAYSASKTILVLGDSLSAEYGLVRGTGWVPLLIEKLKAEKIDANVVNASISGETTSGGKSRLPQLLEKHNPNVVVIELGANDGLRGLSIASTEKNLRDMIDVAKKAGARVLLAGMQIPPNYGADYTQRFAAMYPKLSREMKVSLVPFLMENFAHQPAMFQPDRIHPTSEAQPIMLNNVWPRLKPLLTK
ncbi:arylesterase [Oxalobacteraceae bacterium R-40]|uniref:Arylesterase n=1 Tax=Keguizhuia sedimenti TaxID=3064264 RepID=A0ABU1BR71_9BURK|nr:arylesterase [Oxalobacteraceae bacterium R-40]